MKITVEKTIRFLLEMDQQMLSSRPSPCGVMAELVAMLAQHAEPSVRDSRVLGDWQSVDVSVVRKPVSGRLNQPVTDEIQSIEQARSIIETLLAVLPQPCTPKHLTSPIITQAVKEARAWLGETADGKGGESS